MMMLLITVPSLHTLPEVDKLFGPAPTFTRDQFVPVESADRAGDRG